MVQSPCLSVRARFLEAFGREDALEEGLPLSHGDRVVLVPPKEYRQNASGCAPQLYAPMPSYDFRRQRTWTAGQSFEHIGIQPLLSIAALWIVVFVVAHRGFLKVKNFLYVTLGLHVATTVMLLFKAVTLDGSYKGLSVIRRSDWSHISSVEMWAEALYTSLESAGVTGMVYLAVERFNFFKNNFEEDVLFVVVADAATKAIGTAMTYLFIGYLSTRTGVNVDMLINPSASPLSNAFLALGH
ncbi:sodium-dependent proline transporter-like [Haemaphysalis longicornis]